MFGFHLEEELMLYVFVFKIYDLFIFCSLQLKVTPYMYGIYLLLQHLHSLRRHLRNLGLLRKMASKSEVIRFVWIISSLPNLISLHAVFKGSIFVFCSKDIALALLHLRCQVQCRVHLRYPFYPTIPAVNWVLCYLLQISFVI